MEPAAVEERVRFDRGFLPVVKTLKYVGLIVVQGAAAFALAVYLIGPAMRGEPMPWKKSGPSVAEAGEEEAAGGDSSTERPAGEKSDKKEKGKKKGHGSEIGGLLPIDAVIVNVAETQGRRFLKASMTLEVDGEEYVE